MGSENSALKSYTLEKPPFALPSGLAVYPAVLQDGRLASVFVYKRENEDKVNKAAKHLKTLRHPCLLRFLSCTVEADGMHLVTERVRPLEEVLGALSSAEVCSGVYDILLALVFLHDRGRLTHNNVCLSSVFVSEDGHWKLGGMETVCTVPQATPEFLKSIHSVRDPASIPPEEMSPEFSTLPEAHGHARDAYSFGTLVESVLMALSDQVSAELLASSQQTLHSALLSPSPQCRPALRTLLSHDFFRNDFLEVVNFLKSLTLKSEEEKTEFFKFLLDRVSCLSEELIASRLVPLLLNQLVFAEPVAVKSFLPHLLGPKKDPRPGEAPCLLSPALFRARVVPVLLRLFEVHEEHVRMVLLSHIEAYVGHFTRDQLERVILPQVLLGLRDTSDSIVAITLHSLAVLVSLLGPEVVVGGERTKIFKRTAPGFTKTLDCPSEGNPFSHAVKFPMNGLSDVKDTSEDSGNLPSDSKSEEWPDWGEPEEPENQAAGPRGWTAEAGSPECLEPPGGSRPGSPGAGGASARPVTSEEPLPTPALQPPALDAQPVASSPPRKTCLVQSGDDPDHAKPPGVSPRERPPKGPLELGLGEEFTIQVKKKPVHDPELDWFADMVPEIKPSAAFLILPDLRTEAVPSKDDIPPLTPFSSKFAAAEMAEGDAEGWGEGELNWDESSW